MVDYLTRARTFYAGLDPARQTQLWLGLFAAIATVVGLSWWMTNEPYADLMTGSQDEIGEAAAALLDEGIPTRFDGLYLEVPRSQAGEALGVLHKAKITNLGGIEIPLGASPSVIRSLLLRQDELDLAANIADTPGVKAAAVHIEPGSDALFGPDIPSKASVHLTLNGSANVTDEHVQAIQALVANSVIGMSTDSVAVTDSRGRVLASGKVGGNTGSANTELLALADAERVRIEQAVETSLRPFVGHQYAMTIAANVKVDPVTRASTATNIDGDKAVEMRVKTKDQVKEKTGQASGGAPGVDAGLPERAEGAAAAGSLNKEENSTAETQFAAPTSVTNETTPAGQLIRASVAVSLDETTLAALWATEVGSDVWNAKMQQLDAAAKAAMGFDAERGDTLVLSALPFAPIETVEAPAVTMNGASAAVAPFVPYAIAFVALILAFMFVVRPLMAKVSSAPMRAAAGEMEIGPDGVPRRIGEAGPSEPDLAGRLHRLVEDFQPVASDDLNSLVDQQADASAQVLRQWARDEA